MLAAQHLTLAGRLDGVSLELRPASITAICGPNGAGKSTLLQCLAGLQRPDGGRVTLGGEPISGLTPRERARVFGYLPQMGEIAWDLSVAGLAALGRLPHGDRGEVQVEATLRAVGLSELAQRRVSTLSGGERARALLARVLAGEPRVILADEPLAALDLAHQLVLLRHFRRAAEGGAAVVLVLHDLALAMNHVDRVVVLANGRVAEDGEPAAALSEAAIRSVWGVRARWLGEPGERALAVQV